MSDSAQVMKLSRNGQVSLPAETRHRWNSDRILVVDLGDHVVMRPLPEDPVGAMYGKYRGVGPSSEEARRAERRTDAAATRRRAKR